MSAHVEVMWLLERLQPDYKSNAESRRMHGQAVTDAEAELVGLARSVGLVRGETVAMSGVSGHHLFNFEPAVS